MGLNDMWYDALKGHERLFYRGKLLCARLLGEGSYAGVEQCLGYVQRISGSKGLDGGVVKAAVDCQLYNRGSLADFVRDPRVQVFLQEAFLDRLTQRWKACWESRLDFRWEFKRFSASIPWEERERDWSRNDSSVRRFWENVMLDELDVFRNEIGGAVKGVWPLIWETSETFAKAVDLIADRLTVVSYAKKVQVPARWRKEEKIVGETLSVKILDDSNPYNCIFATTRVPLRGHFAVPEGFVPCGFTFDRIDHRAALDLLRDWPRMEYLLAGEEKPLVITPGLPEKRDENFEKSGKQGGADAVPAR